MFAKGKIKTRCPVCEAKYCVLTRAVGHRAHCSKCDTVFRVTELVLDHARNPYLPTEEDIFRWLNEGSDTDDLPVRPRIVDGATAQTVADNKNIADNKKALEVQTEKIPPSLSDRQTNPQTDMPVKEIEFRQTG